MIQIRLTIAIWCESLSSFGLTSGNRDLGNDNPHHDHSRASSAVAASQHQDGEYRNL
jgi:hypothetical protein